MYKGIAFKFPRNKSSLEQRCGSEARQVSALQQIIFYTEMRFDRNSSILTIRLLRGICTRPPTTGSYNFNQTIEQLLIHRFFFL